MSRKSAMSQNADISWEFFLGTIFPIFGTVVGNHKGRNISKISEWEMYLTHLNNFWIFQLRPQIPQKLSGDPLDIIFVFDKVEGVEYESESKTGIGSSFDRHFGQQPIFGIFLAFFYPVAMGLIFSYWGLES